MIIKIPFSRFVLSVRLIGHQDIFEGAGGAVADDQTDRQDINAYRKLVGGRNHRHALKVWRKENGITQADLAEMLGIGLWMVNAIETGRRVPSFALVEKIVSTTGGAIQPNDLFETKADAA